MKVDVDGVKQFGRKLCEPYMKATSYQRLNWAILVCVFSVAFIATAFWFSQNWSVGIDSQVSKCIDHTVFIVSKKDSFPVRNEIFALEAKGAEPTIKDGTLLAKYIRGLPGDTVTITPDLDIYVNGALYGHGLWHLREAGPEVLKRFIGTRILKEDEYWVMGMHPKSFDSRYYGPVHRWQIKGRVTAAFF